MLNFESLYEPKISSGVTIYNHLFIHKFGVNIGISGAVIVKKKIFIDTNPISIVSQLNLSKS